MNHIRTSRGDSAHHHPHVRRATSGAWVWACECGGASCRTGLVVCTWRQAVLSALHHSASIAP